MFLFGETEEQYASIYLCVMVSVALSRLGAFFKCQHLVKHNRTRLEQDYLSKIQISNILLRIDICLCVDNNQYTEWIHSFWLLAERC